MDVTRIIVWSSVYTCQWRVSRRAFLSKTLYEIHKQGWPSGESLGLSPLCPGFDSRTWDHMWFEFVSSFSLASRVFLRVLRFSSLSKNKSVLVSWKVYVYRILECRGSVCESSQCPPISAQTVEHIGHLNKRLFIYFPFKTQFSRFWTFQLDNRSLGSCRQ